MIIVGKDCEKCIHSIVDDSSKSKSDDKMCGEK